MAISNQQYFGFVSASPTAVSELLAAFADLPPAAVAGGLYATSLVRIVFTLAQGARPAEAKAFLQRIESTLALAREPDPSFLGWRSIARVYFDAFAPDGDTHVVISSARAAVAHFESLRDGTATPFGYFWLSVGLLAVGRFGEAATTTAVALRLARAAKNVVIVTQSEMLESYARTLAGDRDDALQLLEQFETSANPFFRATAHALAGHVRLVRGEPGGAIELAEAAVNRGGPYVDALALAVLAYARVAAGKPEAALAAVARAGTQRVQAPMYPTLLALARAEALHALGRQEEATSVLRAARDRILDIANGLDDPEDRAAWLGNVHANIRTLALSREWLDDGERISHEQ
jgi:hypothetical protein